MAGFYERQPFILHNVVSGRVTRICECSAPLGRIYENLLHTGWNQPCLANVYVFGIQKREFAALGLRLLMGYFCVETFNPGLVTTH